MEHIVETRPVSLMNGVQMDVQAANYMVTGVGTVVYFIISQIYGLADG